MKTLIMIQGSFLLLFSSARKMKLNLYRYFIYNSMGSIDENALQNLNLVVNLTKHIQIKSYSADETGREGLDELAVYFPTFLWVVRDFAL
jgi:hypothetical protein